MVLKTFNVQEKVYKKFSNFCKEHGVSMSRQIDMFMESIVEKDPKATQKYLEKLNTIRKGPFIRAKSIEERYKL